MTNYTDNCPAAQLRKLRQAVSQSCAYCVRLRKVLRACCCLLLWLDVLLLLRLPGRHGVRRWIAESLLLRMLRVLSDAVRY